jgi:hypothetical protein
LKKKFQREIMWNKGALILMGSFFILVGCRSKKLATDPGIPIETTLEMTPQLFRGQLIETSAKWETLQFKATGLVRMGTNSQRFRMEVRMVRDSVIWIDVSDPSLGLRVARALLLPDSAAYYSGLLRRADAGSFAKFGSLLGTQINFEMFQNALIGAPVIFPDPTIEKLTATVATYLLAGPNDAAFPGTPIGVELEMAAATNQLIRQEVRTRSNTLEARYKDFTHLEDFFFPGTINLITRGAGQNTNIELEVREVQKDLTLRMPFNYPTNYEPFTF